MVPVSDGVVDGRQRVVFMDYICLPLVEDGEEPDDVGDAERGSKKESEDSYYDENEDEAAEEEEEDVLLIRKKSRNSWGL